MIILCRLARLLGSGVIIAGLAALTHADDVASGGLGLDQVVHSTLSASPELKLAAADVEIAAGALTLGRAAFDFRLTTAATASRTTPLDAMGAAAVQKDFLVTAGAQRLLRNGVLATSEVSLTRSLLSRSLGADSAKADVRFGVSIPLLRDRGGASSAAAEQAAARDHEAAQWGLRHAAAQQVLAAVAAYWDYQAAYRRLEVLRASEARAERAVEETRALVQADERPPTDLIQLQGNAASKRATRASAEQDIVAARTALGLAMGLPADAIATLPPPATAFPKPASGAAHRDAGLIGETYQRRADLAAAEQLARSASIRLSAARSEQRPRLDLLLNTGYRASDAESLAEPRLDALVELRLEIPLSNSAGRGQVMQSSAAQEQRHIARDELRRRIAADVATAQEAVTHAEATMLESAEAVHLFETGIQAVQRKFQLGGATLFDLIQAQDALTNSLLFDVQSQRDHAIAIAVLRFQSGRLVEGDLHSFRVPVADLVRAP